MRRLIRIAFTQNLYRFLMVFTLLFAILFTVASQLEIFSLGLVIKKGPDLFELCSSNKETLSREELLQKWDQIDSNKSGVITRENLRSFTEKEPNAGLLDRSVALLQRWIPIHKNIWAFIGVLAFVALFKAITLFCYRFGTRLFTIYLCRDVRQHYFEHIQSLPMSFYHNHNIGALSTRAMNDAYIIADGIHSALVNYVQTPFALFSTLALCFAISWQLSCIIFFGLPILIGPIIFIARRIRRLSWQLQKKQEAFSSVLVEFLRGVQTIKLYAMEAFSLKKYKELNQAMTGLEKRNARYDTSSRPVLHTIGMAILVAVILFGLWVLLLPLHEVVCYCGLLWNVYEPVKKFSEESGRIQRGAAACDRLHEVLDQHPTIVDKDEAKSEIPFTSTIAFNNVSFSYGQSPVLSSISFEVKKGETIAIVGPTGGGKSTIVSLLARLFEPQEGSITIDGTCIQKFTQKSLRDFFGVVPQHAFLFHDTVSENIKFGRSYTEEEVQCAAQMAHAEEFIVKLPDGYKTLLAEAGKTLSGGQQQRLALARALIKQSSVLVLDEATSALDSSSELHIKSVLKELKGNITQIIIAHRLSTIEDADRIIVIEGGEKVGDGTKEELLNSCPTFRRLWMPHTNMAPPLKVETIC